MSRNCDNCYSGHYYCDTLDLAKIIAGNYEEGIMCSLSGFDTTPDNVCEVHTYIEGMEEYKTYVMYDDSYLGSGYFIVSELDGEIVKFAKIYSSNCLGFPYYNVRAYEKGSIDQYWQQFRNIKMSADTDEELFSVFSNLASALQGSRIKSIYPSNQGQNNISANQSEWDATISFSKDVDGVKYATDFIDINIGDNITCEHYEAINNFYQSLAKSSTKQSNKEDIKKVLELTCKSISTF